MAMSINEDILVNNVKLGTTTDKVKNNLLISEKGSIPKGSFTNFQFGNSTYCKYTVNFTKTYDNIPLVILGAQDISASGYWGSLATCYIKEITNTKMVIVCPTTKDYPDSSVVQKVFFNYIVLSQD